MKKVYVYVQESCERRLLDAKRVCNYLSKNNYEIVNTPKKADIIFFITCGFLRKVTEDSLENVKKFQKYDAELIVAGCIPEIVPDELAKIFNGKTISTKDIDRIDEIFPDVKIRFCDIPDGNIKFEYKPQVGLINELIQLRFNVEWLDKVYTKVKLRVLKYLLGEHSNLYRYFTRGSSLYHIRICRGCMNNCSYCVIKKAVGPFKSKPFDECIKEFKDGLSQGYKYFVLTGDDTGAYGIDIGRSFPELLKAIIEHPGDYEIILRSLNPQWVVKYIDELENIFKTGKIESADIPIQSMSSRILKLMNRYSNTEKVRDAILRLKEASPSVKLNTCYILGFPTETREELEDTLNFIDEMNFSGHIFPFSCEKNSKIEKIVNRDTYDIDEVNRKIKYAKNFLKKRGYKITFLKNTQAYLFDRD